MLDVIWKMEDVTLWKMFYGRRKMLFFIFAFIQFLTTVRQYFYKFFSIVIDALILLVVNIAITMQKVYPIKRFTSLLKSYERLRFEISFAYGVTRFCVNFVDFCHDSAKYASMMAFAAPKVALLQSTYQLVTVDYTESLLPVDEQECDMYDV